MAPKHRWSVASDTLILSSPNPRHVCIVIHRKRTLYLNATHAAENRIALSRALHTHQSHDDTTLPRL